MQGLVNANCMTPPRPIFTLQYPASPSEIKKRTSLPIEQDSLGIFSWYLLLRRLNSDYARIAVGSTPGMP
jgi:hypothetical protein